MKGVANYLFATPFLQLFDKAIIFWGNYVMQLLSYDDPPQSFESLFTSSLNTHYTRTHNTSYTPPHSPPPPGRTPGINPRSSAAAAWLAATPARRAPPTRAPGRWGGRPCASCAGRGSLPGPGPGRRAGSAPGWGRSRASARRRSRPVGGKLR